MVCLFVCLLYVPSQQLWSLRDDVGWEDGGFVVILVILLDFSLTVKAAPHECVIRTSQP